MSRTAIMALSVFLFTAFALTLRASDTAARSHSPQVVRAEQHLQGAPLLKNISESHFSHFIIESKTICRSLGPTATSPVKDVLSVRCPKDPFFLEDNENVTRVSQRTSYVVSQYKGYARRCSRSRGVMWLRITRAKHDLIADRVLNGLLDGVAPQDRTGITQLLDWGSGCGPTLSLYSKLFGGAAGFRAIGIERIPEAVEWARTFSVAPGVVHCNADGNKLDWLPEASFDFIISYGGIVHLPLARLCPTLQQLLRLLKPGGRMWFGYIHIKEAFEHLLSCSINCSGDASEVVVHVVDEVAWWKDINLHPSYTISKPKSLLWEKRV